MFKNDSVERIVFRGIFVLFCAIVIGATIYYAPYWGVAEDWRNLHISDNFWKHPTVHSFCDLVKVEMAGWGRFRPVFQLWIISVYSVFRAFPTGAYLCIISVGLATLLLWGKIINKIFPASRDSSFNLFIYPLSFFIFTPFWNNFMHLSVLEKFIYFFGTFSIYYYIRAYETDKISYIFISLIFALLGMLSKETGIALLGTLLVYSLSDCLWFRKNTKLSLVSAAGSSLIFAGYYLLIRSIWAGGYSIAYKNNFNIVKIFALLASAPLIMKALVVIGAIFACMVALFIVGKKEKMIRQEYLLMPLFLIVYIAVILPWGFVNYSLPPIAPAMMLTAYPLYMLVGAPNTLRRKVAQGTLILLVFLVLFFIIIPRISKMGDTRKVVSAVVSMSNERTPSNFFIAPPFFETADVMQAYTNKEMAYLPKGLLGKEMLKDGADNYLIFEDRCTPVTLRDVIIKKEVYSSKTWRIFLLQRADGTNSLFMPSFEMNFLERLKDRIKTAR